jgi:hypothetical protein
MRRSDSAGTCVMRVSSEVEQRPHTPCVAVSKAALATSGGSPSLLGYMRRVTLLISAVCEKVSRIFPLFNNFMMRGELVRHVKARDSGLCICGSARIKNGSVNGKPRLTCKVQKAQYVEEYSSDAETTPYGRARAPQASLNARKRGLVNDIKSSTPCADCRGKFPPYVMDFDHVRGVKAFGIGQATIRPVSIDELAAEIAKCDVVCSNCHRERTFGPDRHDRVERSTPYDHKHG